MGLKDQNGKSPWETSTPLIPKPQPAPPPLASLVRPVAPPAASPLPTALSDPGFRAWIAKHGKNWDAPNQHGMSGGYRLYAAYQLGLTPDAAGHLPDWYNGVHLKTWDDPNYITNGIDNSTGYQVAPPTYTGPMTEQIRRNAQHYFHAGTAHRPGGPGGWDDVPAGKYAPAKTPPAGYVVPPWDPGIPLAHALKGKKP